MIKLIVRFITGLMVAVQGAGFGPESRAKERYRLMQEGRP